jgi:hypothetical protein
MVIVVILLFCLAVAIFATGVVNYLNTGNAFRRHLPPADPPIEILRETDDDITVTFETFVQMLRNNSICCRSASPAHYYRGKRLNIIWEAEGKEFTTSLNAKPLRANYKESQVTVLSNEYGRISTPRTPRLRTPEHTYEPRRESDSVSDTLLYTALLTSADNPSPVNVTSEETFSGHGGEFGGGGGTGSWDSGSSSSYDSGSSFDSSSSFDSGGGSFSSD